MPARRGNGGTETREGRVLEGKKEKTFLKKGKKMEEEDRQAPTTNFFLFSRKDNDDDNDSDEIMTR